jgi:hypothetical protein
VRRALLELVDLGAEPRAQLEAARAALDRLAHVRPLEGSAEGALLEAEIDELRRKPDAYLLHEYLAPENRAFYLREVVERASGAGLRWLTDVAPTGVPHAALREAHRAVRPLSDDVLARQQLVDVMTFRQFRASLFCRTSAQVSREPDLRRLLAEARLSAAPAPDEARADEAARVVTALAARWPADASLDELAAELSLDRAQLVEAILGLLDDERVQLRPRALEVARPGSHAWARPRVSALTRFESALFGFATTPSHEVAPLDGLHVALVAHADGRTPAALVEALVEDVQAGRLRVSGSGPPPLEALRRALPAMVEAGLERLGAAGLLLA